MTIGSLRILTDDLFGIARRLKNIDPEYFVAFNVAVGRFEVHHAGQRGHTLALTVPYPELDERTVTAVQKTRAERVERLLAELEKQNRTAELRAVIRCTERAQKQMEAALSKA